MSPTGERLVIGYIVLGLGFVLAFGSFLQASYTSSHVMSPSEDELVAAKTPLVGHGQISISYGVDVYGETLNLSVMAESQYENRLNGIGYETLAESASYSGSHVFDLPKMGKYIILLERASGSSQDLRVTVHYELKGVRIFQAIIGIATFVVGFTILGLLWKARANRGGSILDPRPSDLANPYGWVSFKWPGRKN